MHIKKQKTFLNRQKIHKLNSPIKWSYRAKITNFWWQTSKHL